MAYLTKASLDIPTSNWALQKIFISFPQNKKKWGFRYAVAPVIELPVFMICWPIISTYDSGLFGTASRRLTVLTVSDPLGSIIIYFFEPVWLTKS